MVAFESKLLKLQKLRKIKVAEHNPYMPTSIWKATWSSVTSAENSRLNKGVILNSNFCGPVVVILYANFVQTKQRIGYLCLTREDPGY